MMLQVALGYNILKSPFMKYCYVKDIKKYFEMCLLKAAKLTI